jgi:hypothetical protein
MQISSKSDAAVSTTASMSKLARNFMSLCFIRSLIRNSDFSHKKASFSLLIVDMQTQSIITRVPLHEIA